MTDDGRSVEDEIAASARVALTVAAQLADKFARAREELARQAQHQDENTRRQLQTRFDGERNAARNKLALIEQPEWWDRTDIGQIAGMHETAKQWAEFDPQARAVSETIAREVRDRYGIDVANPEADPRAVRAALAEVELDRDHAARGQRGTAEAEFTEAIQAVRLADQIDARSEGIRHDLVPSSEQGTESVTNATRADEAARLELQAREYELQADQGGTADRTPNQLRELASDARAQAQLHHIDVTSETPTANTPGSIPADHIQIETKLAAGERHYDSATRREALAAQLTAHGIPQESIDVRMRADIAQGRPAADAITQTGQVRVPQTGRSRSADRTSNRPERSR